MRSAATAPKPAVALLAALAALTAAPATPAQADERVPLLEGRAILPAEATAPAPFAAAPNTDPAPAAGARQPVGGFSALIDAGRSKAWWALPDNGFGSKANSRSFLLRLYKVRAALKTAAGGRGAVRVVDWITLRDPDRKVPFRIVNGDTQARLLTGGDFDIEAVRRDRHGGLWFGDEFGPFILHADATGKVLEAPIPVPGVRSPDYPSDFRGGATAATPNLARSNGFEALALRPDGRGLVAVLEGPVTGDDPHLRRVYEFDLRRRRFAALSGAYRVADPAYLVSDLTALGGDRYVALERDNEQGAAAAHKRGFVVDLARRAPDGTFAKREVVDLLGLRDPAGVSLPGRAGDIGLGDPFSMPYQTIEAVLPLGPDRLALVNDTNFGSTGRNPALPDYSDFIVVRVPRLTEPAAERDAFTVAVIGDTPYGDDQVEAFPNLIASVNGDPAVSRVLHLGDIKNGSSTCSDERFGALFALYDRFADPFLYTPGDNEWTDCHRSAAGGYDPLERLAALRRVAYPVPGRSRGRHTARVRTQARDRGRREFVENQLWRQRGVVFSLLHVVGSENDLVPWFGTAETATQRSRRLAEFDRRQAANLAWLERTFRLAQRRRAPAVVIGMQADTFVPGGSTAGFDAVIGRLSALAARYGKPVLLLQGDTHEYKTDQPLSRAPNVRRVVVEGETADEWLRLRVAPRARSVFTWTRERGF